MADVPNYPSNGRSNDKRVQPDAVPSITNVPAENDPRVAKVVSGAVVTKKPGLGHRFKESFLSGETAGSVGAFVVFDVVVPALKSLAVEMIQTGSERYFYGESARPRRGGTVRSGGGYTSYGTRSATRVAQPDPRERRSVEPAPSETQDYRNLEFESRGDAELVIDRMTDLLQEYGAVSVSNLYDLAGITVRPNFQDNEWGWTDLVGVSIKGNPSRAYYIDLPTPVPLGR